MALIVNDTTPRAQYTASGGQTEFAYAFEIFEDADLLVYLTPTGQTAERGATWQADAHLGAGRLWQDYAAG